MTGGVERFASDGADLLREAAEEEADVGDGLAPETRDGFLEIAETVGFSLRVRVVLDEEGLDEPV